MVHGLNIVTSEIQAAVVGRDGKPPGNALNTTAAITVQSFKHAINSEI